MEIKIGMVELSLENTKTAKDYLHLHLFFLSK